MKDVNWESLPPTVITWAYSAIDTVCKPLLCGDWRESMPPQWTQQGAWLSMEFKLEKHPDDYMPPLLTYNEYLQQNHRVNGWESLYKYAFETPSTSLANLTSFSSMIVLLVLVLTLRRVKAIILPRFSSLGRRAAIASHGKKWLQEESNQIRIVKFGEYVFRLLFHSSISIVGIYYFWDKEWWTNGGTKALWLEWPNQPVAPGMTWYYMVQAVYNVEAMLSLLELSFVLKIDTIDKTSQFPGIRLEWSPTARGDFREMFVHHLITNSLVIGSSFYRFTRVGSMVFLVHDVSDVPVDLSKLANFLKRKTATAICFATMVLMWCITRLGILPFVIFKSVLKESFLLCTSGAFVDPLLYVYYQPFFVFGLATLILLHLAWFTMFIQMGYFLVFKGEAHDLSEHKNGESQDASTSRKEKIN